MAYELYALKVPAGGDLEETAEALAARVAAGIERGAGGPAAEDARNRLAELVAGAERSLLPASPEIPATRALSDGAGLRVDVHEGFVRVRIGYLTESEIAAAVMDRVWQVLTAVAGATDWSVYDPQGAAAVESDAAGRDATLEIYLSVVDHIAPVLGDAGREHPRGRFP